MKIAKTLAILGAVVLVVVCFNAPAVFSGEVHPWDEDGSGGGDGDTGDPGEDTTVVLENDTAPDDYNSYGGGTGWPGFSDLVTFIHYVITYYHLPGATSGWVGDVAADERKDVTTRTNAK